MKSKKITSFLKLRRVRLTALTAIFSCFGFAVSAAVTTPQDYSTFFAAGAINANGTQLEKSTTFGVGTWYSAATGTQPSVATSTLSYSTYKDNTLGKQIALTSQSPARYSNFGLTLTTTDLTSGTFYLSFLLNLSNAPASSTFVSFNKSQTATVNRGYIKVAKSGTQYLLTPIVSTTAGTSSQLLDFDTTYLIVLKYVVTTASNTAGAGTASLFVNPTPGAAEPGTPTATVTESSLTNMDYFKGFDVWQQSTLAGTVAGLRFSKTWAEVVPAAVPVSTSAVTAIAATTATGNGTLGGSLGTPAYTDYGICYKTSAGATINDSKVSLGAPSAIGTFTASLTGLTPNTTYYANAYATNTGGTTYGTEVSFLTLAAAPAAPTVGGITATSVNIAINENGNPATTTFAIKENNSGKYVQDDGTILNATNIYHTKADWGTKTVTGLTANTSYSFLAKAQNSASASVFGLTTTKATLPAAPTSTAASAITSAGFTANWTAPTQGAVTFTYTLEYGTISDLSSGTTVVSGIASANLSNAITGLLPGTTYYYHILSSNASGVSSYSTIQSVTTNHVTPTVGTYSYNGNPQGPTVATNNGTGTSYTFSYASQDGTTYPASSTLPTAAG
ncbi:MAG: fibronectin type III domain-containing protein, partial [Lentisphaerota bacterium]